MIFSGIAVQAQDRTISGKVTTAEEGAPVPGVNVVLKNTIKGTVTDSKGDYRVSVPQEGAILVFTFIGLRPQEVEIGSHSVVDVQMPMDTKQLNEWEANGSQRLSVFPV